MPYQIVGANTGRVYDTAKTLGEARSKARRMVREEFLRPGSYKVVRVKCRACGR